MPMTEQVAGHGGRVVESVAWPHRCVPFWHTCALYSGHRAVSGRTAEKRRPSRKEASSRRPSGQPSASTTRPPLDIILGTHTLVLSRFIHCRDAPRQVGCV